FQPKTPARLLSSLARVSLTPRPAVRCDSVCVCSFLGRNTRASQAPRKSTQDTMRVPRWARDLRSKALKGLSLKDACLAGPDCDADHGAPPACGHAPPGAPPGADAFAAAWVAKHLAAGGAGSMEEALIAACTEGSSGVDAALLRDVLGRADGDPRAAVGALAALAASGAAPPPAPGAPHDGWMLGPPKPACHAQRVRAADGINKMRATRDGEIEAMLRLLCAVFDTDTATCALLTGECIYIVGGCGAIQPCICPDRWGFCGWSFLNAVHELLVIEDMDTDARFAANFFVVDPAFRLKFYVAAPLVSTDGHRLGTLCVMGHTAQRFDATRAQCLANLAEMMVRQLERKWAQQLAERSDVGAAVTRLRPLAAYDTPYLVVDTAASPWRVMHMNVPAADTLGMEWGASYDELANDREGRPRAHFEGVPLPDLFDLSAAAAEWKAGGWEFALGGVQGGARAELAGRRFTLHFRLATSSEGLDAGQPLVGVPSFVALCPDGFGRSLFFARLSGGGRPAAGTPGPAPRRAAGAGAGGGDAAAALSAAALGVLGRGDSAEYLPCITAPGGWGPPLLGSGGGAGRGGVALGWACPIEGLLLGPLLGRGSYGRVYRGVYHGQPVAVKIIDSVQLIARDAAGEPLEVSLTRGLGHPNLMRTVTHAFSDAAAAPGGGGKAAAGRTVCWMVFEYADRGTVADAVVKGWFRTDRDPTKGATDLRQVALTGLEVAGAMAYLHARGVLHGDLCGGNIMMQAPPAPPSAPAPFPAAKVGDFGLCRRLAGPGQRLRLSNDSYGTVTHVAPEVLLEGAATQASDVYSFGVMMHEMLTGSRAWAGLSHSAVVLQVSVLGRDLAIPEGLPPPLDALMRNCLSRDAAARPSFAEAAAALAGWLQETRGDDLSGTRVGRRAAPEAAAGEAPAGGVGATPPCACARQDAGTA
ncbi:MAG: kinase-like domain-containing protein, partial [Monoraphidium minutum]